MINEIWQKNCLKVQCWNSKDYNKCTKQAEPEVVPSSSSVKVKVLKLRKG